MDNLEKMSDKELLILAVTESSETKALMNNLSSRVEFVITHMTKKVDELERRMYLVEKDIKRIDAEIEELKKAGCE